MDFNFYRIGLLPPYILAEVTKLRDQARARGEDVVDFGMGNPDHQTPKHIVDKLIEAAHNGRNHRYSQSVGIKGFRLAVSDWYADKFDVRIDPATEAIAVIGSKEGLAHLMLAIINPNERDAVLVPDPCYPIHKWAVIITGGQSIDIPLNTTEDFLERIKERLAQKSGPKPKGIIVSFPANPTTHVCDLGFLEEIVELANRHDLWVVHDLAYADLVFDGYRAPSILQVPGAKERCVESFTLSKSYHMPGWRVGFLAGNKQIIGALARMKSYLDYGMFQPIQIAAVAALRSPASVIEEVRQLYLQRRDWMVSNLNRAGWPVEAPKATMFLWAPIPESHQAMGSLEFSKMLVRDANVAVAPGIGFGQNGDSHVRFALIENHNRIVQACRNIKQALLDSAPEAMSAAETKAKADRAPGRGAQKSAAKGQGRRPPKGKV